MSKTGPSVPSTFTTPLCRGSRHGMSLLWKSLALVFIPKPCILRWSEGVRHRFRDGFRRSFPCEDTVLTRKCLRSFWKTHDCENRGVGSLVPRAAGLLSPSTTANDQPSKKDKHLNLEDVEVSFQQCFCIGERETFPLNMSLLPPKASVL
jgi:hypothetical protein